MPGTSVKRSFSELAISTVVVTHFPGKAGKVLGYIEAIILPVPQCGISDTIDEWIDWSAQADWLAINILIAE